MGRSWPLVAKPGEKICLNSFWSSPVFSFVKKGWNIFKTNLFYLSIGFPKKPNCKGKEDHCSQTWQNSTFPISISISPDATRQSARVLLKMSTSVFAATTRRTNLILATNMKRPMRNARIVADGPKMFPIVRLWKEGRHDITKMLLQWWYYNDVMWQ